MQVNLGYRCNQSCSHCHVDAGPWRTEMMAADQVALIPQVLEHLQLKVLDLTGGAPELHPQFRELVAAARTLGAQVDGEDKFLCTFAGWRDEPDNPLSGMFFGLAPTNRRPWEIYVDASGKRFVREDHHSIDHLENALKSQPGMKMFIIADEGIVQNAPPITPYPEAEFKARLGNHPNFAKADTLSELAQKIGVDAANLEETVARFNAAVDSGVDAELGREFLHRRIDKPPFYAMGASGITVVSPAGLNADGQLRVLRAA